VLRVKAAASRRDHVGSFSKRAALDIEPSHTIAPSRQKTTFSEALNPFKPAVSVSLKNLQIGNNARLMQPKTLSIIFLLSPSWSSAVRPRRTSPDERGKLAGQRAEAFQLFNIFQYFYIDFEQFINYFRDVFFLLRCDFRNKLHRLRLEIDR
jgi:hypothetical protein